jgi:hypothetical protein
MTGDRKATQAGSTGPELGFSFKRGQVSVMSPAYKGRPRQLLRRGSACNDGSIPREYGPPYSCPRCISLYIGPLGVRRRLADRSLSVFVIESLCAARALSRTPGVIRVLVE